MVDMLQVNAVRKRCPVLYICLVVLAETKIQGLTQLGLSPSWETAQGTIRAERGTLGDLIGSHFWWKSICSIYLENTIVFELILVKKKYFLHQFEETSVVKIIFTKLAFFEKKKKRTEQFRLAIFFSILVKDVKHSSQVPWRLRKGSTMHSLLKKKSSWHTVF